MKYLALVAVVLAGCSQEPRQYGAPIPLVWSATTFNTPTFNAPTYGVDLPPKRSVLCQRVSLDSVSCF
jgi:hypothetical protein